MTTADHITTDELGVLMEQRGAGVIAPPVLIDAHVHFHPMFDWPRFLEAARESFARAKAQMGLASEVAGCLLFTETPGEHRFHELRDAGAPEGWTIKHTNEAHSVLCFAGDGTRILVIAGRQTVTREGLEVLGLACDHQFSHGQPIVGIVEQINGLGGFPVVPWGFGKWHLRRKRVVRRVLRTYGPGRLGLGDNGNRPRGSLRPRLFAKAEARGIPVLPGSDPLPFGWHEARAGSYGFVHEAPLDGANPAQSLVRSLRALRGSPKPYGRRSKVLACLASQVGMQWRRRMVP